MGEKQNRPKGYPLNSGMPLRRSLIGSSDGDCAPSPSHTTVRTVFRIRRLNPAAVTALQDPMA